MSTRPRSLLYLAAFCAVGLAGALSAASAPAFPDSAAIDREDRMWRVIRPEDEVETNLARLEQLGAPRKEIAAFAERLTQLWSPPAPRDYGWLSPETVAAIAQIDRDYLVRMRAARLRAASGLQTGDAATPAEVAGAWHRAVLRVLDDREIAELRFLNAPSSRHAAAHAKNIVLTDDERRQTYDWQRDFDALYPPGRRHEHTHRLEDQLALWARVRSLLGDGRFADYLREASPTFARLQEIAAWEGGPSATTTGVLDLWWLWQTACVERMEKARRLPPREVDEFTVRFREDLLTRLGPNFLAALATLDGGHWLAQPRAIRRYTDRKPTAAK